MAAPPPRPVVAVGAVIWDGADAILLVRRGRPPRLNEWSIPGGKVEWGEGVEEALRREAEEETGLRLKQLNFVAVVDALFRADDGSITDHYVLIDYWARACGGTLRVGDDAAEARWVRFEDLDHYPMWSETRGVIAAAEKLLRTLPTNP